MAEKLNRKPVIPTYVKERKRLNRAISRTYRDMLNYLTTELTSNGINVNTAALEKEVGKYLKQLNTEIAAATADGITKAFNDGRVEHILTTYKTMSLEEAKSFLSGSRPDNWLEGTPTANYTEVSSRTIREIAEKRAKDEGLSAKAATKLVGVTMRDSKQLNALIRDTYADILLATNNTEKAVKKVVREAVRDVAQYHSMTGESYKVQAKELEKRLTKKGLSERIKKEGFVGITDKAGRKWDIGTYSDMVIKTKTSQAYTEGVISESADTGIDLAVISSHGAEDACSKWEGVVVSLTGATEGYPTLDEARASGEIFHPNCQHNVQAIRTIDLLHADDKEKHFKKVANLNKK